MSHADIIQAAALWDHETVAREAMEWAESPAGKPLLRLKPSQFAGLLGSARKAASAGALIADIEKYISDLAGRQKSHSVWHSLLSSLPETLKQVTERATSTDDSLNESFRTCCLLLRRQPGNATECMKKERDLAAMRAFMDALARRYRARRLYGVKP
jgi:hypothetical protein